MDRELAEVRVQEATAVDELRAVREENRSWEAWFVEAESKAKAEFERARAAKAKLEEAMARLRPTEEKLKDVLLKLSDAEERAEKAKAVAWATEEKVAVAKTDARAVWENITTAETQAREAVEQYKGSTDFAEEMSEVALDAYFKGFEHCKNKIFRVFKIAGPDEFQLEDSKEEEELDRDGAEDGPGPVEP